MGIGRHLCGVSVAAVLMSGALAAGCGGSDDSATATMSAAEFVAEANAICARGDKRMEAAAGKYLGPGKPTRAQLEEFATAAVIPHTQEIVDGIEELTPPARLADAVDEMTAEAQSVHDRLKADPGALASSEDPFAEVNRLARRAGLDACDSE